MEKPKRLGIVSTMYQNLTASYLTEGLGNVMYNKQKGSKFQKLNSLLFEWEIDVNLKYWISVGYLIKWLIMEKLFKLLEHPIVQQGLSAARLWWQQGSTTRGDP